MNNLYLKQAIRGIKLNPSRTILTTLGIMIGIGTVILVLSAGEGFKSYINSQVEINGSNAVFVKISAPKSSKDRSPGETLEIKTLKEKDIEDIKKNPNVVDAYGAVMGQQVVTYKDTSKNSFVFGATASRFDIDKGEIEMGRGYSKKENESLAQVALLGSNLKKDLFGEKDPLGSLIRVGNYNFEVIGVYAPRGGFDDQVFIPARTLQKKIMGIDHFLYLVVELKDNKKADATSLDIADVLRKNHYITDPSKDDFKVSTQTESLDIFNNILKGITFLLIAIASISLLVGGVGVMNIMYVIVTERIGEIGLKKALGAKNKDILYAFLIESLILTLIGGAIGIVGGSILAFVVSKIAQSFGLVWKFIVPVSGVVISLVISIIIGVIFGVFPARNAAKLNPIVALNKD